MDWSFKSSPHLELDDITVMDCWFSLWSCAKIYYFSKLHFLIYYSIKGYSEWSTCDTIVYFNNSGVEWKLIIDIFVWSIFNCSYNWTFWQITINLGVVTFSRYDWILWLNVDEF